MNIFEKLRCWLSDSTAPQDLNENTGAIGAASQGASASTSTETSNAVRDNTSAKTAQATAAPGGSASANTQSGVMSAAQHLIVGAGPAGVVAAETLRKLDPTATITLVGDEPEPPYSRMAIPYLLEDNIAENGTYLRKQANHFKDRNIAVVQQAAVSLDTESKTLGLEDGSSLSYDRLLLATGSTPNTPPIPGLDHPRVANCWTLDDARQIMAEVNPGVRVVQIGAGFIGCIVLESLVKRGAQLTIVEMGETMVPRMLAPECGKMLQSWCESKGVSVLTGATVEQIAAAGDALRVSLSSGDTLDADFVITATGVSANTGLAETAGIKVDQGVVVDRHLQTSAAGVYAAGDVAQGLDFSTGEYSVQAIQPVATEHGMIAAKNMLTNNAVKFHGAVSMNVLATLDLVSVSYGQWQGVAGGEHCTHADPENYRFIQLQFDDDRLVGANTLGITHNVGALRGLIQQRLRLGEWKPRLLANPQDFMQAYVALIGNHR